jgi:hypothetical protein
MARESITLEALARRLSRYATQTDRRLKYLEDLVKKNGLNGAAPVLHKLEPIAEAAEDLVIMARDHRERRELAAATAIVDEAAKRAHQRKVEMLMRHWWYRRYVAAAAFFGDSGQKLYYAVLGAVGLYLVMQGFPVAVAAFSQITHVALAPVVGAAHPSHH